MQFEYGTPKPMCLTRRLRDTAVSVLLFGMLGGSAIAQDATSETTIGE